MAKRVKPVGSARLTGHFLQGGLTFLARKKHGAATGRIGLSGLTKLFSL
jgi:hypothetical protein